MLELAIYCKDGFHTRQFRTLVGMLEHLTPKDHHAYEEQFRTLVGMLEHTP